MADDPATPPEPAAPEPAGEVSQAQSAPAPAEKRRRRREAGDLTSSSSSDDDLPAAAPKKRRAPDGGAPERARAGLAGETLSGSPDDSSSREAGERSRRTHHTDGALVSSDATSVKPKRRRRAEGDLTSSSSSDDDLPAAAPRAKSKRAEAQLVEVSATPGPAGAPAAAVAPGGPVEPGGAGAEQEAQDALFGLFAVKLGVVSEAQVEKAFARQRAAAAEGQRRSLARVLVEMAALTQEKRDQVLAQVDPEVIPGYRIEGEAGRGGMGVVYRARQLSMDRAVALKVLSRRLSSDPSYVTKFLAEARSAGKLNHENVVAAIDAGAASGLHYFVMEFVSGRSVAEMIERDGPIPWARAFEIAEHVARGLHHAHQVGLVHRDVKPENILLTAEGRAKLCDLGLAKAAAIAGTGGKSDMTEGTPYYCSPEQATGRTDIDARSDVYSLGTTLYHMLKGQPPFDGDGARAILVKQVREPFPDLDVELPQVPPAYRRLLWEMVKKDRDQRLPSMRAFEERLVAARKADASAAAPAARRGGGKGALALVGVVFVVFLGVGALGALALLGPEDDPGVSTATEVSTVAPPPPTDTGPSRPPRVTRVTESSTTERDPEVDPPVATESPRVESEAARALASARRVVRERSDDPAAGRDALLDVAARFPATQEATDARREAEALTKLVFDAGFKRFEALTTEAIALVRDGSYRAASEAIDAFAAEWEPRALPGLADQLTNLRRAVEQQAQARLDDAVKRLEAATTAEAIATAQQALDDLLPRVPARVAEAARSRLDALARDRARREAEGAADAAIGRRDQALARGDRASARAALEAALTEAVFGAEGAGPARARVIRAQEELEDIARAWDAFDAAARRLADDEKARLRPREGEALRGRLVEYDPGTWRGRVKLYGQREEVALDLHDLHPEDLLALALPPAEGRANVLFFVARGAPEAAAAAYAAWIATGARDDVDLQARVQGALGAALEARVARELDAALKDDAPPGAALNLGALLDDPRVRATGAYRDRYERLKEAYQKARAAQLAAAPELLFKGELKAARRGDVVTLKYTFKDPAQLQDWTPDVAVDRDSSARADDDGMIVKGKLSHIARFQGGELGVELKATTSNGRQPNLNVIVGDRGGWTGVLMGLGFMYGALQDLRVDPTAPRKPGYTVPLPANVCVVLDGRAPRADGPNFAAETTPSVQGTQGRAHKFDAARAADGAVRLRLRGRDVYRLPAMPDWDKPGGVALAPFGTEIAVQEVEIVGRLDEAWVTARAQTVATAEAAALPAPTPAPAPAPGGTPQAPTPPPPR